MCCLVYDEYDGPVYPVCVDQDREGGRADTRKVRFFISVSDQHKFLKGSGSGIPKMSIRIPDLRGSTLKKKNYTKKFSTKSVKMTLKEAFLYADPDPKHCILYFVPGDFYCILDYCIKSTLGIVTHRSPNHGPRCLTSVIRWELVFPTW